MSASTELKRARFGKWELLLYNSQIEAVHMALLHTGKVLMYSGFRVAEAVKTETRLWDVKIGDLKAPPTPADLFCAGHCTLPDGRLLSTGGTLEYRGLPAIPPWLVRLARPVTPFLVKVFGRFFQGEGGLSFTGPTFMYLFDPKKEAWEFAGDMAEGRWYPTNTTLPDGRILILSGTNEGGGFGRTNPVEINRRVEVYDPVEGLRQVSFIHAIHGHREDEHTQDFPPVYPRMHVLPLTDAEKVQYPAGKLFYAGGTRDTKFLNVQTWEWEEVAKLNIEAREDGCSVLLPLRPPDYRPKVLTFGGIHPHSNLVGTETAEMIDLRQTPYKWETITPLRDKRLNACAVLLPDGKVLVVGGNRAAQFDDPVLRVELFDPKNNTWSEVAPMTVPRAYHSTAVLLPDGRVLSAGTTPFSHYELRMEVYSPYYLFKGTRPRITQVSANVHYGQTFEVSYEYSGTLQSIALIRPGAVTHAFDMDQRYVELTFQPAGQGRLTVESPQDANLAPPGYYMLFLLGEDDVPSEAAFVQISAPPAS
jgi:hypothetical protein